MFSSAPPYFATHADNHRKLCIPLCYNVVCCVLCDIVSSFITQSLPSLSSNTGSSSFAAFATSSPTVEAGSLDTLDSSAAPTGTTVVFHSTPILLKIVFDVQW